MLPMAREAPVSVAVTRGIGTSQCGAHARMLGSSWDGHVVGLSWDG